ncbi:AP-1 complex-associated regulatory protein-like isoform X1 [Limulus polyphemus]|uniref:AP-1 complex-associated regulatory protein-like isoform X1 n=1 Tax=Limulus polyphemus TaxID=6850 RepID=A0ABM1TAP6_LIMPO|nr:AP-1 complex-associated regulatory protein-like isoform X1 [Limulus polyphemus]XP_022252952.1 AP-1 complex-associated regulatory protein-like isoform X1 [Limulus polyphemus]XP_022252954.1 AP-1 complex-associated regulatory protein-like isoform X1 [Limulus polyphemus]
MGDCFSRCCPVEKKNRCYTRTKYFGSGSMLEFENLIPEEDKKEPCSVLTPHEKELLESHHYDLLLEEQREQDHQVFSELLQKEEILEMEDAATIEARREAAKMSRLAQSPDIMNPARLVFHSDQFRWLGDDPQNWHIAGNDDFDSSSDHSKVQDESLVPLFTGQKSLSSSVNHLLVRDRLTTLNTTPPSSIDLEWEDEAGLTLPAPEEEIASTFVSETTSNRSVRSTPPSNGNELEWDGEFTSVQMSQLDLETEQLISEIEKMTAEALNDTGPNR